MQKTKTRVFFFSWTVQTLYEFVRRGNTLNNIPTSAVGYPVCPACPPALGNSTPTQLFSNHASTQHRIGATNQRDAVDSYPYPRIRRPRGSMPNLPRSYRARSAHVLAGMHPLVPLPLFAAVGHGPRQTNLPDVSSNHRRHLVIHDRYYVWELETIFLKVSHTQPSLFLVQSVL